MTIEGSYARNQVRTDSSFSPRTSEATIGDIPIVASNPYLPAAVAAQVAARGSTVTVGGVPTPGFTLGRLNTDLGQWVLDRHQQRLSRRRGPEEQDLARLGNSTPTSSTARPTRTTTCSR